MASPALAMPLIERPVTGRRVGAVPTLEATISAVWARIGARRPAVCPLCQGEMRPEYGAGALPVAARCHDCGTVLS